MSPSTRGSAADRIEVDPDVLIRAGQRLTAVGVQLGLIADLTKPLLANGIASGWDPAGINFALEYADLGRLLAPAFAAAANGCKAVGLMVEASGHNYKNADAASTLPGGAPMGSVGEAPPETSPASIPSGPNGIVVPPPGAWAVIYPVVQFFGGPAMTWPFGNPTFMGVLAAQWDTIGKGASAFNDDIDAIKTVVSMQDIPERDRMLEDLQKIDDNLAELSIGASGLAGRIRDFAQGVEDNQNAIRRILDRVSSLDSVIDTVTGLFSGEAQEIARDVIQVLRNFQRQVKAIVGLLNQAKQAINDAMTAFQEMNRRFLIATFGDQVGDALADGFDHYTDFQVGVVNGLINTVSGTVAMLDADTWKGMYEVAMQVADDPSKLDDVLLNMGKEFLVWDAWSGEHPGRAAGEAAFNIASLFNPYGGPLTKTGTLAKGFRYGSTLAREGRLPRFSDLPGIGGHHTPTFEAPRGLPSAPEFRPGGVPGSLISPSAPGRFDPPTTPGGSGAGPGGPHETTAPHTTPGGGDGGRGGGGGDGPPPGSGGRPVEPPDPGPRHNGAPTAHSPTAPESPPPTGHSAPTPEASSPGSAYTPESLSATTPHAPESPSPSGPHDGTRSPSESTATSEHAAPSPESTGTGHQVSERTDGGAQAPTEHQPTHAPTAETPGTPERVDTAGGHGQAQEQPQAPTDHAANPSPAGPVAPGVVSAAAVGHIAGGQAASVSHAAAGTHAPDASSTRSTNQEALQRNNETGARRPDAPEGTRASAPGATGPIPGQSPAPPVRPAVSQTPSEQMGASLGLEERTPLTGDRPRADQPSVPETLPSDRPGTQPDPGHSSGDGSDGNGSPPDPPSSHVGPPGNPADQRVYGPHELKPVETPAHQVAVENALRDADGNILVHADPRSSDYGRLINDGGPTVSGRSNNCLDCALSALTSFYGDPTVSAPRWPDQVDGVVDRRSGELSGLRRAENWLGRGMLEFAGLPIVEQFDAIHRYVGDLGPGASALIHNGWHARDLTTGEPQYHSDGSPMTAGSHATVVVYPDGASGPVWWDPQRALISEHPPSWMTSQSTFVHFTPIDPSQGAHHGEAGNHGASSGLPGGDVAVGDVPGESLSARVGVHDGAEPGGDGERRRAGNGEVGDRRGDGDRLRVPELVGDHGGRGVHGVQTDGRQPGGPTDLPLSVGDHDSADSRGRPDDRLPTDGPVTERSTGTHATVPADHQQAHLRNESDESTDGHRDVPRGSGESAEPGSLAGDRHDSGVAGETRSTTKTFVERGAHHDGTGDQGTGSGLSGGGVADRDVQRSSVPPRVGVHEGSESRGDGEGRRFGDGETGDRPGDGDRVSVPELVDEEGGGCLHGIQGDGRQTDGPTDLSLPMEHHDAADRGGRPDDHLSTDSPVTERSTGTHATVFPHDPEAHTQVPAQESTNEGRYIEGRSGEPPEPGSLAGDRDDSGVAGDGDHPSHPLAHHDEPLFDEGGAPGLPDSYPLPPTSAVTPPRDGAFFWSGRDSEGVGVGPREAGGSGSASRIADEHDGTTLEDLLERNGVQPPKWSPDDPAAERWWSDVSAMYAQNASGEVRAVVGSQLRPDNIWQNVEYPRLLENPNVTRVTEIDAETGRERVLFDRGDDGEHGRAPTPNETSPSAAEHPPQSGDPPGPDYPHDGPDDPYDGWRDDGVDHPPAATDPSAVEHDGANPAASDGPDDVCDGGSEPVNLATGEYFLPAVDADLPGVLPLRLSRIHKSQYRHGVWMGPTWSCTFDARAVVTADTVSTIDADGTILSFDHPSDDETVVARRGRRWTLAASPTGGYRLRPPDGTTTWHFEPKPQLAGSDTAAGVIFVSAITDVHGNSLHFTYTDAGAPSAVVSSGGYRVGVDSRGGRIRSYTLATDTSNVVLRRFSYTDGDLSAVTDAAGATTRFEYDDEHRMVSWTDSIGATYSNTYDDRGRVAAQSGADGVWAGRFTYADNGSGVTTTYTDGIGASSVYEFDGDLRPTALTSPAGAVQRTEFTATRAPARSVDATGATTTIAYTDNGLPGQVVDPLGRVTTTTYVDTPAGPRVAQLLDPAGGVVSFGYDAVGNRVSLRDADGGLWRWEYTATGAVSARVDPLGRRTQYRTNAAGLPVVVVAPGGDITQLTYDALGNLVAVDGPDGARTRMTYDAAGRMSSRTAPDDTTEYWAYDGEGNRVSHTDAAGATTRWEYGFFDLPVARVDADGSRTRFDYDNARRLRSVTNPAGLTWSYRYHPDGTLAAQTDFNGATTSYTYDAAGRVASRTNASGQTVTFEYDAAGQVIAESSLGGDYSGERVEYAHDLLGRTTAVAMPWSRISVDYDAVGRVVAEDFAGRRVVNEFDAAGELVCRTTPSGVRSELSYDGSGALDGLVTAGTPCAVGSDAYGRAARMQFGAAAIDSEWDAAGRLALRRVLRTAGTDLPVATARFGYDPVGSLTSVSAADPAAPVLGTAAVYGTDVVGRLVSRRTANAVEHTVFDASQNATVTEGGEQSRWQYRGTLLIDDGRSRYRYDEAGRVVHVVTRRLGRRPDVWKYRWDAWDRLRSVTAPDGREHHYTYDPAGRRLSKQTDDDRIEFAWAGDRMVEQTTASTTTSWSYQPGHISPYAQIHSPAVDPDDVNRRFFAIVTDQIETPVALVDPATGEIAGRAEASMWGATRWTGVATPWRYPGQYHDPETGLHYNRHRYYQPGTGRYLSPDPLGLAPAPNPYGYPGNPTAWSDPLGLAPCRQTARRTGDYLSQVGSSDTYRSPGGLEYGPDTGSSAHQHRTDHVLAHTIDNPRRVHHGVFTTTTERTVFKWLDEAYAKLMRGEFVSHSSDAYETYTVDMGYQIGYSGGSAGAAANFPRLTHLRLALQDGIQVVTAFPVSG